MKPSRTSKTVVIAALFSALTTLAMAPGVRADNPFDALVAQRAREVSRAGRAPRGVLPLLRLFREWDEATPAQTMAALERLASDRRLTPARRAYVGALLARARLRTGAVEASSQAIRDLGYVTDFRVIGSFDNEGKQGFNREMPPEAARMEPWEPGATYPGRERPVSWRRYPAETSRYGYVNFDAVFRPYANVCGFAETFVDSERAQPLSLWVGNGGAVKVWWNGEEVLQDELYRQPDPDRHVAMVAARQGHNRLLVKLCVAESTWGFFLRLGDRTGGPARGVTADASEHRAVPAATGTVRMPQPLRSVLADLEGAAEGESPPAQALEDLARFLAYTGADDAAERRAKQLAARAADADPSLDRLRLASFLADERGEVQRFGRGAHERYPNDPDAVFLWARVLRGGPSPDDALPLLAGIPDEGTVGMRARLLSAEIYRQLELTERALAIVEGLARRAPGSPGWLQTHADYAEAANRMDLAIDLRRAAVAARYDSTGSRRTLAVDAHRRGDVAEVEAQLDALIGLEPDSSRTLLFAATLLEGLDRPGQTLALFNRARDLAPEDASVIGAHGRYLLRLGQREAAADALRLALSIRPQDADIRELLEQIRPEQERLDESYAVGQRELLARRVERSGFPTTVLQSLTVNTVFENGLGSSFHQHAAQVHDDEGARQLRTYSIQFDPDTQRVDVRRARVHRRDGSTLEATQTFERQLGEPWYRIYYDTRALVVVFPDLEPGDTIELQYRIDDVAHRNLFADYYGDLHFLQGFSPTRRLDYVLITPSSREFFFNRPRLRGLRHEREERDGRNIDHFFAEDVPAIRSEQSMPGMTEIAPYLHVSTYRTWEDVGHWWWGLIQDQLQVDDHLRQVVRDLMQDAPDLQTRVSRIHNWVVRNTRYVGLEFGIHGYKPYRVPLIVQRGFGDCKDKASLLYTMFREAGIDARIVLVRTRRNGAITDLPASLAVFDHAIAYVPELDLYIDGTAEHSGTTELPNMDQGVTVLIVGPDEARLARTPVLPPDRSRRTRTLDARLEDDGSATIDVEEEIAGADAASYRSRYAPEGTRAERFERALRPLFPGLVLESQVMENLDGLEAPIRVRYRAAVPQMARRDGDTLSVQPSVLDDLLRRMAGNPSRRYPLDLGGTSSYSEDRTLQIPRGFRVGNVPAGGLAESDFGRLRLQVDSDGRVVRSRTEFELRRDRIAPGDYQAFRRWVEEADSILRQQVELERGGDR